MRVKTEIFSTWTARVYIPEAVFQKFGHLWEYDQFGYKVDAENNAVSSGQDAYSDVYEWAEFHTKENADNWVRDWEAKITEWGSIMQMKHCDMRDKFAERHAGA